MNITDNTPTLDERLEQQRSRLKAMPFVMNILMQHQRSRLTSAEIQEQMNARLAPTEHEVAWNMLIEGTKN